jgi:hypothetical protein
MRRMTHVRRACQMRTCGAQFRCPVVHCRRSSGGSAIQPATSVSAAARVAYSSRASFFSRASLTMPMRSLPFLRRLSATCRPRLPPSPIKPRGGLVHQLRSRNRSAERGCSCRPQAAAEPDRANCLCDALAYQARETGEDRPLVIARGAVIDRALAPRKTQLATWRRRRRATPTIFTAIRCSTPISTTRVRLTSAPLGGRWLRRACCCSARMSTSGSTTRARSMIAWVLTLQDLAFGGVEEANELLDSGVAACSGRSPRVENVQGGKQGCGLMSVVVVAHGGPWLCNAKTVATAAVASGAVPDGRVLSRSSPSTPCPAKPTCQSAILLVDWHRSAALPLARSAFGDEAKTILARRTCFGAGSDWRRSPPTEPYHWDYRSCI